MLDRLGNVGRQTIPQNGLTNFRSLLYLIAVIIGHRCDRVDRTHRLCSSTCFALSWCGSLLLSTGPFCCFLCL